MPAQPTSSPSSPTYALGPRIRSERVAAGVSLRELARRVAVSPSLLSQIERGLAQPSVGTLWALVSELGFSLDSLFTTAPEPAGANAHLLRANARRAIELDGGIRWEGLTPAPDADVDFAYVTYAPGRRSAAGRPAAVHRGREYGFLISGCLSIEIGDAVHELLPGDTIVFDSQTPHRFRAVGDEPAHAVWWNLKSVG
jgi:transcriptional regulator with XRE-family HTH domain